MDLSEKIGPFLFIYTKLIMTPILHSICLCLFWLCWAPLAILKDLVLLLYVPFDSQRLVNCYVAINKNSAAVQSALHPQAQPEPEPERHVGFKTFPTGPLHNLTNAEQPENPENPDNY